MLSTPPRVWFVTGCSTGFGRALSEAVLNHGERLVATARDVSSLNTLAHLIPHEQDKERRLLRLRLDVTKEEEVDEAFKKAVDHFGRIDVVVNNAGFTLVGEFESVTDELAEKVLDVNLWGVIRVSRAALRVFREVNERPSGGRLLQISSVGGAIAFAGSPYYHASKFALEGLTEALAKELKPEWNIKVTIIQPGGFKTDFAHRSTLVSPPHPAYAECGPVQFRRKLVAEQPQEGRAHGGDASRAAEAIFKVAGIDQPPLRLPLGPDAVGLIKTKLKQVEEELDQWLSLSLSTSDEVDQKQALEKLQQLGLKI